jgi:hypothetical protein
MSGPTEIAREVFLGEDSWLLAWLLHKHSGLPIAIFEERQPGSRHQVWRRVHALLTVGTGQYLDVTGLHPEATVRAALTSSRGMKIRITAPPKGVDLTGYEDFLDQDISPLRCTDDIARYVATSLLTYYCIAWRP